ncbi:magnesium transporter CorA family protein [Roseibium sp.]|uniref:magnesium transporter CorA family protein n=1 Tax=Roseibium sp. TaxID=1936156 RepID=UPI003A96C04B
MIIAYCSSARGLERRELSGDDQIPSTAVWIDLLRPTDEELHSAEALMGAEIPTRAEIASIETSARLYDEPGAIVMTALLPMAVKMVDPELSSMTFVLSAKRLVTVRYGEPQSVAQFVRRLKNDTELDHAGPSMALGLIEQIIDRAADVMEEASRGFDRISVRVFEEGISARGKSVYQEAIREQGRLGLQVAKMHDVCTSLARLLLYLENHGRKVSLSDDQVVACQSYGRDIHSIKEHGDALDNKLSFLLDATVGLVTLEQNQIFKIFSVLGVIFLPPTLIASIYGMNFVNMPELQWQAGFLFSIGLMATSIVLTYVFLRWKRLL